MAPRAAPDLDLYLPQRTLQLVVDNDQLRPRAVFVGQVPQEGVPGSGNGWAADVHEGGGLPEGEVIAAGEETVAVGTAFGEGWVGQRLLERG